jgi:hypothetical protein
MTHNFVDPDPVRAYKGGRCLIQSLVYYQFGSCSLAIQALVCGIARAFSKGL